MPFDLHIPKPGGETLEITLNEGQILFVLGANGVGKSSFMHHIYRSHHNNSRRITAHRQTWFSSNMSNLSPENKRNYESNIHNSDTNLHARWKDDYSVQRTNISIHDLIDAENARARIIASAVDGDNIELAKTLSRNDAPIKSINELLRLANLPIEISIRENEQIFASKLGSPLYSIAELSDGERNALLIATDTLTAKKSTLFLIDEPERHLHRSIISPLLTHLFAKRPDCAFIISTHDVMLPIDNSDANILLIRGCSYTGSAVSAYDAELITSETEIDDDLKIDILGARRKLLFVEGTERSLDKPLYNLVFPNVSVISKSSCRDVEYAVAGIRDAEELHWLRAFGIVDNDRRTPDDIERLKAKGIYAISTFSVESIYYHPDIQCRVVERITSVTGEDALKRLASAKSALIAAITPHIQRLSERTVERAIRKEVFRQLPQKKDITAAAPINISIDIVKFVMEERKRLEEALSTGDLLTLITRYPIRETAALKDIANNLGFQNREQYEKAVLKLLMDDNNALAFVRTLFDTLEVDIEKS